MKDQWNREVSYLRISVTDQCSLHCAYCRPAGEPLQPPAVLLSENDIVKIAEAAARIGIRAIKFTGGEPLLRKNILQIIERVGQIQGIEDMTLTTNGALLGKMAHQLFATSLSHVNVNLPSLDPDIYKAITGEDILPQVLAGIQAAALSGLGVRINCVNRKSLTEGELLAFGQLLEQEMIDVRFIEMMPMGNGVVYPDWNNDRLQKKLEKLWGEPLPMDYTGNGPARYWQYPGKKGRVGMISAITHQFCGSCSRIRLTADGKLKLCLEYDAALDLKPYLEKGWSTQQLAGLMEKTVFHKPRAHHFCEGGIANADHRKMYQIGG